MSSGLWPKYILHLIQAKQNNLVIYQSALSVAMSERSKIGDKVIQDDGARIVLTGDQTEILNDDNSDLKEGSVVPILLIYILPRVISKRRYSSIEMFVNEILEHLGFLVYFLSKCVMFCLSSTDLQNFVSMISLYHSMRLNRQSVSLFLDQIMTFHVTHGFITCDAIGLSLICCRPTIYFCAIYYLILLNWCLIENFLSVGIVLLYVIWIVLVLVGFVILICYE